MIDFIEQFSWENEDPMDVMQNWRSSSNNFRWEKIGMYTIAPLSAPYNFAATMLCWLLRKVDATKFSIEKFPLIDEIVNATILNWSAIFSNNLAMSISEYRHNITISTQVIPPFYMSAYVMDAICFFSHFPNMGWKWTSKDLTPIHVYHKLLWESHFCSHFYNIYHGVMLPIYQTIFIRNLSGFQRKQR